MVETRLTLEPEVQEIFEHIGAGKNFLLSGGAGSGKTFSLVQIIQNIMVENPAVKIACMTYTNAAVREIESRVNNQNLSVSTIHDFLWDTIKTFQKEIKNVLIELINSDEDPKIKAPDDFTPEDLKDNENSIQYKEYVRLHDGIISHDEVLLVAHSMFDKYPKLCDILKDKFNYIFIDEYQDTSPLVIEIMLCFLSKSTHKNIIGFFGDAMQSIYDEGIGDIKKYVDNGSVAEVKKQQNRRSPRLVYELANKLRTDGIEQIHSSDIKAPNMDKNGIVKTGDIKFYYSDNAEKIDALKQKLGWDFKDTKNTKELNLTHNLIAPKAGFGDLMQIYDGDKIIDYVRRIKKYILDNQISDNFSNHSFEEVILYLQAIETTENGKKNLLPTKGMQEFIEKNLDLYERAKKYKFEALKKIYIDKSSLIDDKKDDAEDSSKTGSKRDNLIKHLFKIQDNISLYEQKEYNEFLRKTEFKITSTADKQKLKYVVTNLQGMSQRSIEYVINYADEEGICRKDDRLEKFATVSRYIYDQVKSIKFEEFQNLYSYLEGRTPFSTQHKIKGAEFNNVLVVLDNGNWNKYNFEYLLNENIESTLTAAKKRSFSGILERTRKLFYVCCTRAKENLAIYYINPSEAEIETAKNWFGKNNVINFQSH